MRIAAIVCNLLVLGSTAMTVVTEGLPGQVGYLALTLSVLLVSLLSAVALAWSRAGIRLGTSGGRVPEAIVAAIMLCNVLVCAACLWVAVSRYPYSEGNGIIPFAVLLVATPVLTVVALLGQHAATGDTMSTTAGTE
jgi:hypothetical protein